MTAAIFIILEVAACRLINRTSTLQNIWINRFTHRVMALSWGFGDNIRNYFSLSEMNDRLAQENFRLSRELDYYRNLYPEERVWAVDGSDNPDFRYIPATIVKISRNTQHNYIILNKGYKDGVESHSGIITPDGVVGIIDAVDAHYSYGLTIMNTKISISSRVGSNGVVASLVWNGITSNGALLKNVPLYSEIAVGDTICTSGISDVLPGDIPLGAVREVHTVDGVVNEASVDLFQDLKALRYVTIVSNPVKYEIVGLEEKEDRI